MRFKRKMDNWVHKACVDLKERWAEDTLGLVGWWFLVCTVVSPFVCVVPYGTREEMKKDLLRDQIIMGAIACVCIGAAWLLKRRRKKMMNQSIEAIVTSPDE